MLATRLTPIGRMLVTTFGLGFMRPFSGTWGSMPPVLLAGLLLLAGVGPGIGEGTNAAWSHQAWLSFNGVMLFTLVLFTWSCIAFGDAAEARFNRKDPSEVVADETAGVCIPLLFLPAAALATPVAALLTLTLAFGAFRATDILKLPPAYGLQRLSGGVGVVADDLVAGVQAAIVVQLVTRLVF